jgi:ABC-type transport system involved in Fe-S cluster assembly fused permease/ATPase subunit
LSTAANADNIIVLDKGAIIEEGNHETLIQKKGKYFEMWEKQKPV